MSDVEASRSGHSDVKVEVLMIAAISIGKRRRTPAIGTGEFAARFADLMAQADCANRADSSD